MLVIPKNRIVIDTSYANFKTEANTNLNFKQHIYDYQKLTTDVYSFQNIPINLSRVSSINIENSTISVVVNGDNCTIQVNNNEPVIINGLTDKSQLLLKPQLIDNVSYWTIIYNNMIVDQFVAEKKPNNYINNMTFEVKDINIDENNRLVFN